MEIDRDSTEYLYDGWTGDPPSVSAEVAFMEAGVRPTSPDWNPAIIIADDTDPLWADAVASGVTGDYFTAVLVGPFGGNTLILTPPVGDGYQKWNRLTDVTEQPIRISPQAVEVL